jgi:hypothetical protein
MRRCFFNASSYNNSNIIIKKKEIKYFLTLIFPYWSFNWSNVSVGNASGLVGLFDRRRLTDGVGTVLTVLTIESFVNVITGTWATVTGLIALIIVIFWLGFVDPTLKYVGLTDGVSIIGLYSVGS